MPERASSAGLTGVGAPDEPPSQRRRGARRGEETVESEVERVMDALIALGRLPRA